MAGLNTAQIIDLARSRGISLSNDQAQQVLSQAWDQSQYGADANKVASLLGGGAAGAAGNGVSAPPAFSFDWTQADNDALAKLTPYYQQKLDQANGDVNLAKQRLAEDYQNGTRTAQTAYDQTTQNAQTDYGNSMTQENQTEQQETQSTRGALNNKGVLATQLPADDTQPAADTSQYAQNFYFNPLTQQQQARKQAIDLALSRQNQIAQTNLDQQKQNLATTQQRGIEDQTNALTKTTADLNEQKQEQATTQMAPLAYQEAYQKYKALNNIPG